MEYYNGRYCISARELIDGGIVTVANYGKMVTRKRIEVVRRGGGNANNYALIAFDSLSTALKQKVEERYPGGRDRHIAAWLRSQYEIDNDAIEFYCDRGKTGHNLGREKRQEYVINASVLNTCILLLTNAHECLKLFGVPRFNWERMSKVINALQKAYGHTLPGSTVRFRKKVRDYQRDGYRALISKKFGNQCARKNKSTD